MGGGEAHLGEHGERVAKHRMTEVEQDSALDRTKYGTGAAAVDEVGGVEDEGRQRAVGRLRGAEAQGVVDDRLPRGRELRGQLHAAARVRALERATERHLEGGTERLRGQVDVRAELLEVRRIEVVVREIQISLGGAADLLRVVIEPSQDVVCRDEVLEALGEGGVEKLADRPEVLAHLVDLLDDASHESEVGLVLAGEVEDRDVARLAMAVEPAITLFEASGVPRDIEVQEIPGGLLQVEALGGRIGSEEHAYRVIGVVEGALDLVAFGGVHTAVEHAQGASVGIEGVQAPVEILEGGLVLREHDQAFVREPAAVLAQQLVDLLLQAVKADVGSGSMEVVAFGDEAKVLDGLVDGLELGVEGLPEGCEPGAHGADGVSGPGLALAVVVEVLVGAALSGCDLGGVGGVLRGESLLEAMPGFREGVWAREEAFD